MDNLSEQQYEAVLRYMEECHEDNFQEACRVMGDCGYDMEVMRERRRRRDGMGEEERELDEEEDEEMIKMKKFLLRKSTNKKPTPLQKCTQCIRNSCLKLTQKFVPQLIKRKVIRSNFCQIYQDDAVIQLLHRNLSEALAAARNSSKRVFVVVSEKGRNHCVVEFLRRRRLLLKIAEEYQILGIIDTEFNAQYRQLYPPTPTRKPQTSTSISSTNTLPNSNPNPQSSQLSPLRSQSQSPQSPQSQLLQISPPSILILRQRHTQDLQLIEHLHTQSQILSLKQENLVQIHDKIRANVNKESALLRRITERLFQESYNALRIQGNFGEDQEGRNQLEEFGNNRRQSKLIAQQNRQYLQMQRKKQQRQLAETRKKQQLQQYLQQRKCRKLSIPDQPEQTTQNILKVIFRCPNGDTLTRKFQQKQKCELLFTWVQLNDQIQFQGEGEGEEGMGEGEKGRGRDRKFDLLYSYPPESLREKVGMELGEVFEGQQQVKILIREL